MLQNLEMFIKLCEKTFAQDINYYFHWSTSTYVLGERDNSVRLVPAIVSYALLPVLIAYTVPRFKGQGHEIEFQCFDKNLYF